MKTLYSLSSQLLVAVVGQVGSVKIFVFVVIGLHLAIAVDFSNSRNVNAL